MRRRQGYGNRRIKSEYTFRFVMSRLALIRAQVETRLLGRVPAPFALRPSMEKPVLPTGIGAIDDAIGGLPCGGITEIVGQRWCSSGLKSFLAQTLSLATCEYVCALIDATDSFDPKSAAALGVNLRRLLWVRCSGRGMKALEQALKSADVLLQGSGGFGILLLDLSGVPERLVRKIPLSTWFRFRGVMEKLSASLVILTPLPVIGTCADVTLHLSGVQIQWSEPTLNSPSHARLAMSVDFELQMESRRLRKKPSQAVKLTHYPVRAFSTKQQWA